MNENRTPISLGASENPAEQIVNRLTAAGLELFVTAGRVSGRMPDRRPIPWEIRELADQLGLRLYNDAVAAYLCGRQDALGRMVGEGLSVEEALMLGRGREPGALRVTYNCDTRRCCVYAGKDGQDGR